MSSNLERITSAVTLRAEQRLASLIEEERAPQVRAAHRALMSEARRLSFPAPSFEAVEAWFVEAQLELLGPDPDSLAAQGMESLARGHELWRKGELQISAPLFHAWRFTPSLAQFEAERKRHPNPAVVAFDCDGVLYNFNETLRDWLVHRGWDRASLPDPTVYSLSDAWGLHDGHLQEEIFHAVEAGKLWNVGSPLYDGISAARFLGMQGHTIIINTARRIPGLESKSRAATLIWLRSHGVHPDGLHLADPRVPEDKLAVDFDIILDDHASNVAVAIREGREALLIDRPWNGGESHVPRATFPEATRIIDRQRMPMPVR